MVSGATTTTTTTTTATVPRVRRGRVHFRNNLRWEWKLNEAGHGAFGEDLKEYIAGRREELRGEEEARLREARLRRREKMAEAEDILEEFREGVCGGGEVMEENPLVGARRRLLGEIVEGGVGFVADCLVGEVLDEESRRDLEPWIIEMHGEVRRSKAKVKIVACVVVWFCVLCSVIVFCVLFGVRSRV